MSIVTKSSKSGDKVQCPRCKNYLIVSIEAVEVPNLNEEEYSYDATNNKKLFAKVIEEKKENKVKFEKSTKNRGVAGKIVKFALIAIIIIVFLKIFIGFINSSGNNSRSTSINGTYVYKDSSVKLRITILGNSWSGKTTILTGFGSDWDNQNTEFDSGVVKGKGLYDSSGFVKIGYVSGNNLYTSIANKRVTLRKN